MGGVIVDFLPLIIIADLELCIVFFRRILVDTLGGPLGDRMDSIVRNYRSINSNHGL